MGQMVFTMEKFYTEYIDNFLFMGIETKNMTGGILIPISTENKTAKKNTKHHPRCIEIQKLNCQKSIHISQELYREQKKDKEIIIENNVEIKGIREKIKKLLLEEN